MRSFSPLACLWIGFEAAGGKTNRLPADMIGLGLGFGLSAALIGAFTGVLAAVSYLLVHYELRLPAWCLMMGYSNFSPDAWTIGIQYCCPSATVTASCIRRSRSTWPESGADEIGVIRSR